MTMVPYLPETAPFSPAQRQWLNGYFAGLYARGAVDPALLAGGGMEAAAPPIPVTVLFGSQTGTSEGLAREMGDRLKNSGCAPAILCMDEVEPAELTEKENLLLICSTYGDGEMPDNAQGFWDKLTADDAPSFSGTRFSVCALGDTSYETYCTAGKELDARFEALGAERLAPRVDCDVDFEEPFEEWVNGVLQQIGNGTDHSQELSAATEKATAWSKKNPYPAKLTENRLVTAEDSSKEIRHFVIDLGDSGITYEAGDALNVVPLNAPALVDEFLDTLQWDADTVMDGGTLGEILRRDFEIRTPAKKFLDHLRENGPAELVKTLDDESWMYGKDIVDLIQASGLSFTPTELLPLLRGLQARAYSISSSLNAKPNEVHLTIASVRYEDTRAKEGVCSCFLADRAEDADIGVWIHANKAFSVPADPAKAMIMVGPGTGIAPFLGFLQEREAVQAPGKNWLFFGERNQATDFLYETDLSAWTDAEFLKLSTAFSRDQKDKIYVQDRMREAGAELFAWLEDGAYFYVCGDAYRMAKDVDAALHEIIAEHGKTDAEAYVAALKKEKRYVRDVY